MSSPDAAADPPLCVDLDGTLIQGDTLVESAVRMLSTRPWDFAAVPLWLVRGKGHLLCQAAPLDPQLLPYNQELLDWLRAEYATGRTLLLTTGAPRATAEAIAAHLGIFHGVLCTDDDRNHTGESKAAALAARFGGGPYDYVGDSRTDLPVWRAARHAVVANPSRGVLDTLRRFGIKPVRVFAAAPVSSLVLRAMRPHQWTKNLLVFLPLVTSHLILLAEPVVAALLAFAAFSLTASAVYLVNDLLDLHHDRLHPRKRHRPFASGQLSPLWGLGVVPLLIAAAIGLALPLPREFLGLLGLYLTVTFAYSAVLKRRVVLDVVTLAGLYTLRVVAGAAAITVALSPWLLAFAIFLFLSLALVKRVSELDDMTRRRAADAGGRGYRPEDAHQLASLGSASACTAVLVLALYVYSPEVRRIYEHPMLLWLLCPLLLYWLGRMWILARRGEVMDDPLVFAIRDRVSYLVMGAALFTVFMAI